MYFGRFRIDRERLVLEHDGTALALAPKSVELLAALAERPGQVVAKRELLDRLWPDSAVEEANLSQHVYVIRKALEACQPDARTAIVTVPKRGYRFVFPLAVIGVPRASAPADAGAAPPRTVARTVERYAVALVALLIVLLVRGATDAGSFAATPVLSAHGAEAARIGRYNLDLRTRTGITRSRVYFAGVVASDPQNPSGYAGSADALVMTADYGVGSLPRMTYLRRAARMAQRAVALGPSSAQAHASLGLVAHYLHDDTGARRELQRSIELDPGYAPAHHWLGSILFDTGEYARSLHELTIADELNPISTASNAWLEIAAYFGRRYDVAIEHGKRTIELDPERRGSLRELGLAYDATGDYRSALATFARIRKSDSFGPSAPYLIAAVYAHAGRPDIARRILAHAGPARTIDVELPFALLALGNSNAAAAAATRIHFADCHDRRLFVTDPRFDPVRADATFGGVLNGRCAGPD